MSYPPFNPQGIGTLNETARNMFRQQPLTMPYGPAQQLAYQQPQFGMGGMQQGNGINQYGQYLERTYGDPEFDQKRDTFLQDVQQKERQTFGGGGGSFGFPAISNEGYGLDPSYTPRDRFFGLEKAQIAEGLLPNEMQLFASGGEAMGPPPTRGPDPQGIGAYQQFADGGPVYMQEGGDPNFKLLVQAVQKVESNFDSRAVSEDGAIGLMQILPTTAAQPGYEKYGAENVFDIAERLMGFRDERTVENARALLFDPEINVEFGTKYLQAMIRDSGGDILQALQKYNAGVGNYQAFEEDPENNPLDQEAVQYPIKVTAAYQNFDPSNPLELAQFSNRPEAASQMMAMYEQPEPELVRPRLRPEFLGDKGVTTSLRPQLRPQGIMSIQDPAVMDRVVEQVQEELPPTQEERDLYEKYSPENMFPDAGLTEGEMIRRERFAPKEGDAEPYRQPPSTLEQIDQFFQRFAPSRKPERVIQPKPTPMQYRSA